jgi:hypothetical protein
MNKRTEIRFEEIGTKNEMQEILVKKIIDIFCNEE